MHHRRMILRKEKSQRQNRSRVGRQATFLDEASHFLNINVLAISVSLLPCTHFFPSRPSGQSPEGPCCTYFSSEGPAGSVVGSKAFYLQEKRQSVTFNWLGYVTPLALGHNSWRRASFLTSWQRPQDVKSKELVLESLLGIKAFCSQMLLSKTYRIVLYMRHELSLLSPLTQPLCFCYYWNYEKLFWLLVLDFYFEARLFLFDLYVFGSYTFTKTLAWVLIQLLKTTISA